MTFLAHTQAMLRGAWDAKKTLYLPGVVPPEVVGVDISEVLPALTSGELADFDLYKGGVRLHALHGNPGALFEYEENKATLIIRKIDDFWPSLKVFGDILPKFHSVSLVMSKAGPIGTPPHIDLCHVLALQMAGDKHWAVRGAGEFLLKPGDALYTPYRVYHKVTAVTDCWHLSFKYDQRTY